jgi:hypothetical protein
MSASISWEHLTQDFRVYYAITDCSNVLSPNLLVKNLFTLASSVVSLSARSASTPTELARDWKPAGLSIRLGVAQDRLGGQ